MSRKSRSQLSRSLSSSWSPRSQKGGGREVMRREGDLTQRGSGSMVGKASIKDDAGKISSTTTKEKTQKRPKGFLTVVLARPGFIAGDKKDG